MKARFFYFLVGVSIALFTEPTTTLASQPIKTFTWAPNVGSLIGLISKIAGYFLYAAGALAFLMLVVGGIRYIVSAGDEKQTEGAKDTITYAIMGLVICAVALLTVKVITNVLSASSQGKLPENPPQAQSPATKQQATPSWIEGMKSKVITSGGTIKKCSYGGKDAYSIPVKTGSKERDAFTTALYSETGAMICYTSGGFSGKGDGKCPTFNPATCSVVWTKT